MNLLYESPPDTVEVGGKAYPVYTDFRDWLRFFDMQEDASLSQREKLYLMTEWYREKPPPQLLEESLKALVLFASRKDAPPEESGEPQQRSTDKVLSWSFDAPYVYAAFLSAYHIDLLTVAHLHWHVFLALFEALPEDTPIKKRMGYRGVNLAAIKDKSERKRIRKIQDSIRIPRKELDAYQCGAFFG